MNQETLRIIDSIARERKIDKDALFSDIESAMVSAARKHFGSLDNEEFRCRMDRLTGEIRLWRRIATSWDDETGEPTGDFEEKEIDLAELGRIPAQTAKQVMIQRFREDERASISQEFSKRIGELVTGTAQRYEGKSLIVQIDRAEAIMPISEQIPGEQFHPGDRVRCMILDVKEMSSLVKIVITRADPDFIRRLFELEVPEVAERIIEVKAMSREPGFRTKLAVSSIDSKVDAVGACVGVRGSRIKNIVDELGGEKIDIVRWNDSSQILIQNSLKPAEVRDVSLCFELGRATVIVENDQLSLAIGKRGQNVRLAARLTGWDIDILTPDEYAKGLDVLVTTLNDIGGLSEQIFDQLAALGMISVFDVEEVGPAVLADELDITPEQAELMVAMATERGKQVAEEQQREKQDADKRQVEEDRLVDSVLGTSHIFEEDNLDPAAEDNLSIIDSDTIIDSVNEMNTAINSADKQAANILGEGPEIITSSTKLAATPIVSEDDNSEIITED